MKYRFAPSPTGKIHIGNARSAILNWIFCKKNDGKFILRIDDTDQVRSSKEFEDGIKADLQWLGIDWDYTFNQSSRIEIYNEKINILKKNKRLYPCFETEEELSLKKKSLLSSGKPPIYDRTSLNLSKEEINHKIQSGKKPHWRFKLETNEIIWKDLIKGDVSFNPKNLSDPVLIREDGTLLYHLPSVIDDIEENITHIIRGEDHIVNTAYHIQIFEALESNVPIFAHHPFLVDDQGKGFSKRMGSLSISSFKDQGFENIVLLNYFLFIGSSSNIVPMKDLKEVINKFDINNVSKSSAKFSKETLLSLNENTLKLFSFDEIKNKLINLQTNLQKESFWRFVKNNITYIHEVSIWEKVIKTINNYKDFNIDKNFLDIAANELPNDPYDYNTWDIWTTKIKDKTGIKGKDLFMPLRLILTGKSHGPELKYFIPLFDKKGILQKLGKI